MDLREQEYVVALAKHQSITRAAEEAGHFPARLSIFPEPPGEADGRPLFDRVGSAWSPTCAGELYVRSAREDAGHSKRIPGRVKRYDQGAVQADCAWDFICGAAATYYPRC